MFKLYEYFIKFICLFFSKKNRRIKRDKLLLQPKILAKNIKSRPYYNKFLKNKIKEKSILIVEPNPYHFELLPGYCNYFQFLGYHIDLIAQPNIELDSPFIKYKNKPIAFYLSPKYQKKALKLSKIKKYDFVFLSTSVLWTDSIRDSYIKWLGFEPKGKYGFFW